MLSPGQTVDRFTVEALLGEGGMAAVYRVRHNTLGSLYALKLLKLHSEAIRKRLVLEGQVQASLHHPNVVAVTDVLFLGEHPGLVMELVQGPTLDTWLLEHPPELHEAEALFLGIVAGVARAHRAGLVHRDLKPGNVLLDSADGTLIPKVTDFGLAKVLDDNDSYADTRSGMAMGTPQFMAPEQVRSAKDVDQRADIWALGCILYQMITGRPAFEGEDIFELYAAVGRGAYTPPEQLVPGLPARFSQAIAGCLVVDREQRIPDCEALRQVLLGADDSLSPEGRARVGVRSRLPEQARLRLRAPVLPTPPEEAQAPAPVSLDPSALTQTWSAPVTVVEPNPTGPPPRRSPWVSRGLALLLLVGVGTAAGMLLAPEEAAVSPSLTADPSPPVEAAAPPTPAPAPDPAPPVPASPAPAAVEPAPIPASSPRPKASAPRATGRVVVTGAVESVQLFGGGMRRKPGEVPAGTWRAWVTFAGRDPIEVGPFEVDAGVEVTLACDASFVNCRVQ